MMDAVGTERRPGSEGVTCTCPYCRRTFRLDPEVFGRESAHCKRCGHSWEPKSDRPKRCPNCRSVNWDTDSTEYTCRRCSHTWTSVMSGTPRKCPACQSTTWNRDSVETTPRRKEQPMDAECEKRIIACHERGLSLFDAALTSDIPVLDVLAVYREHDWFRTS